MSLITIGNRYFEVCNPADPYWTWVKNGNYDHEWDVYRKWLKPEDTFVDCGAWIGSHSLYASRVAKRIVACEPDPVAFKILIQNLDLLDPHPEIVALNEAVAEKAGTITIGSACLGASTTRRNLADGNNIGAAVPEHTIEVPARTLREIVEPYSGPLFIKIDVEGSEEQILQDWHFFHERKPTLFIEMHEWWWADKVGTRKNFARVADAYTHVEEVKYGLFLLEA